MVLLSGGEKTDRESKGMPKRVDGAGQRKCGWPRRMKKVGNNRERRQDKHVLRSLF